MRGLAAYRPVLPSPGPILAPALPWQTDTAVPARTGYGGLPLADGVFERARLCFDNEAHHDFCQRYQRNRNYFANQQLEDEITDPETGGRITEREAIARQNRTPTASNEVGVMVRNLTGTLALNRSQPQPFAVDRDDADAAAMMGAAVKGVFHINGMGVLEDHQFTHAILSGREVWKVRFAQHWKTKRPDVCIDPVQPQRFGFNASSTDPRGADVTLVFELTDLPFDEVVMAFAVDPQTGVVDRAKAESLARAYGPSAQQAARARDSRGGFREADSISFRVPSDEGSCRVIWVWEKTHRFAAYIEDPQTGEIGPDAVPFMEVLPGEDPFVAAQTWAEQEWMTRVQQYVVEQAQYEMAVSASGGLGYILDEMRQPVPVTPPLEPAKPVAVERYEPGWTGWALTPGAEVLWTGLAPWLHGEHPYVWMDVQRIDGRTWGIVEDVLDPQRMYNRISSVIDFMFGVGSKGGIVFDKTMVDANETTDDDVNRVYASADGALGVTPGTGKTVNDFWGIPPPSNVPAWAMQWMASYADRISRQSGINPAAMGEVPAGDTSGFSYQLQQIASSTNTRSLFDRHFECRRQVALKAMQNIAQYYTEPRQLRLSARRPPVVFDPTTVADMEWDLQPADIAETATAALVWEKDLLRFLELGGITFEEYLDVSGNPLAPELLAMIRQRAPAMLGMPAGQVAPDMMAAAQAAGLPPDMAGVPPGMMPPTAAPMAQA